MQATRMFARSATTAVPAAAQNLPPVSEAEDPQLAGLAYPKVPEVNRQLRPAKTGWWDEQDRWNQSEAVGFYAFEQERPYIPLTASSSCFAALLGHVQVSENEDVLSVWGPDQFPKFPGGQAASYLAIAGLTMAAVTSFIVWSKPERPYVCQSDQRQMPLELMCWSFSRSVAPIPTTVSSSK